MAGGCLQPSGALAPSLLMRLRANREAQTVVLFSALNLVLGLASNRLLTGAVPPFILGELYLFMNVALWLTLPTASGYVYVARHWPVARAHGAVGRLTTGIFKGLAIQALVIALGAGALRAFGFRYAAGFGALALVAVSIGQAIIQALEPIQGSERRRVIAGILGLLGTPARQLLLALGFVLLSSHGFAGLLVAQAGYSMFAAAASMGALAILLRRHPDSHPETPVARAQLSIRSFLAYAGPYLAGVVAAQLSTTAERWGLARRADTSATALFVQAVGLSTAAASACTGFLTAYFLPIITQSASTGQRPLASSWATSRKYVALAAAVLGGLVVAGATCAAPATRVLFGDRFQAVEALLPWTLLGAALFAFGQVLAVFPHSAREPVAPNVAYIASRGLYAALLVLSGSSPNLPLTFSKYFAACNALYVVSMSIFSLRLARRESIHT